MRHRLFPSIVMFCALGNYSVSRPASLAFMIDTALLLVAMIAPAVRRGRFG